MTTRITIMCIFAFLTTALCADVVRAQDEDSRKTTARKPGQPAPVSQKEYAVSKAWLAAPRHVIPQDPPAKPGQPQRIPLLVDRGACTDAGVFALGAGIPLREGQVRNL